MIPPILAAAALVLAALPVVAQEAPPGDPHEHILKVLARAPDTPGGRGYLGVARDEARIARDHARLAASGQGDLDWVKAQVAAAVNAIDPGLVPEGPGLGFGMRPALRATVYQVMHAMHADPDNQNVVLRAAPVTVSAQTAMARLDEALEQARRALAAPDLDRAREAAAEMDRALALAVSGQDLDANGDIAWSRGEGGLRQATSHMRQMAIGEGMALAP